MKQETSESGDVPQAEGSSECVDKNSEKKRAAGETSDVEEKKRKKTEREEAAGETVTAEGADSEGSDVEEKKTQQLKRMKNLNQKWSLRALVSGSSSKGPGSKQPMYLTRQKITFKG